MENSMTMPHEIKKKLEKGALYHCNINTAMYTNGGPGKIGANEPINPKKINSNMIMM